MVPELFIGGFNHLLAGNEWARARLKPFGGQGVRLEMGPLVLPLTITSDGHFRQAEGRSPAGVTLTLPADTILRFLMGLADRQSLLSDAKVSGSAELADGLGFVFRHLEWDAEDELAPIVGDIAARRLVQGGRRLAAWQCAKAVNLAQNLAEYFTEEDPLIASRQEVVRFCGGIDALDEQLVLLERRVAAMEHSRRL